MPNLPDYFIQPPDAPQRQKLYRGHATARARLASIIDAGELDSYTVQELATKFGCSERTIANYIASMTKAEVADISEDMLPLYTTRGRMLLLMDRPHGNCEDCNVVELCRFLVWRDCLLACEKPLIEEIYGTPEPEIETVPDNEL